MKKPHTPIKAAWLCQLVTGICSYCEALVEVHEDIFKLGEGLCPFCYKQKLERSNNV